MSNPFDFEAVREAVNAKIHGEAIAAGQLTLGALIDVLKAAPESHPVFFDWAYLIPGAFDSYRGYYDQLSIQIETRGRRSASTLLAEAQDACGRTFTGYKGGDFLMHRETMLWAGLYGHSGGARIIGAKVTEYHVYLLTKMEIDE